MRRVRIVALVVGRKNLSALSRLLKHEKRAVMNVRSANDPSETMNKKIGFIAPSAAADAPASTGTGDHS